MEKLYTTISYRGVDIPVYDDDYSQCYFFRYKGKEYSCDTYCTDYYRDIISVIDDDLDENFYVDPLSPNRPSAKVYQLFGVWYMDYGRFNKVTISYGDMLPEAERPTRDDLVAAATAHMRMIDTYREHRREYDENHTD